MRRAFSPLALAALLQATAADPLLDVAALPEVAHHEPAPKAERQLTGLPTCGCAVLTNGLTEHTVPGTIVCEKSQPWINLGTVPVCQPRGAAYIPVVQSGCPEGDMYPCVFTRVHPVHPKCSCNHLVNGLTLYAFENNFPNGLCQEGDTCYPRNNPGPVQTRDAELYSCRSNQHICQTPTPAPTPAPTRAPTSFPMGGHRALATAAHIDLEKILAELPAAARLPPVTKPTAPADGHAVGATAAAPTAVPPNPVLLAVAEQLAAVTHAGLNPTARQSISAFYVETALAGLAGVGEAAKQEAGVIKEAEAFLRKKLAQAESGAPVEQQLHQPTKNETKKAAPVP